MMFCPSLLVEWEDTHLRYHGRPVPVNPQLGARLKMLAADIAQGNRATQTGRHGCTGDPADFLGVVKQLIPAVGRYRPLNQQTAEFPIHPSAG